VRRITDDGRSSKQVPRRGGWQVVLPDMHAGCTRHQRKVRAIVHDRRDPVRLRVLDDLIAEIEKLARRKPLGAKAGRAARRHRGMPSRDRAPPSPRLRRHRRQEWREGEDEGSGFWVPGSGSCSRFVFHVLIELNAERETRNLEPGTQKR
jgi:hypothetical protein